MRVVVIDSELLVLLVVGIASREYISRHRRLRAYTEADFDLLSDLISRYSEIIVTPNTLTEASNLLGYVNEPIKRHVFDVFRKFIGISGETYLESKLASERDEFVRLGLTDSVLLKASEGDRVLVTADLDLYLAACASEHHAVNFNHLREARKTV
ncbi:MAG TPA: PIN domain-containing protein [Rhizomicrobium sp.]